MEKVMFFKKILATALAAAMALSAVACTKQEESSSSGSSSAGGTKQTEVHILQSKSEHLDDLKEAAKTYMGAHPDVKIDIDTVRMGDYSEELVKKLEAGEKIDVFNIEGPRELREWGGILEELTDQPWVANAVEGTLPAVTKNDKVYGLPCAIEGYGLVYNRAIFETAGIATEGLNTFTGIEAAMKALKEKIDSGALKEKYPALEAVFELPAGDKRITGLHTLNLALAAEFAGPSEAYDSATVKLQHESALKALVDLQAAYTSHADKTELLNAVDYGAQVAGGISAERVAMIQQGNWIYREVANIDEETARNLDLLPLPLKGVTEDSIPVGVPMYWCVNKQSGVAEKKAAKEFLNWLYQSEEGKRIVVEEMGFIPPFTNYNDLQPDDPLGRAVKEYADAGKTLPWVYAGFPEGWGQEVFGMNLQRYFAGEMKWEELLADAKTKWEEARANSDLPAASSSASESSSASA